MRRLITHFSILTVVVTGGFIIGLKAIEAPETKITEEQPTVREIASSEKPSPTQDEPSLVENETVEKEVVEQEIAEPSEVEQSVVEVEGTDFIEPSNDEIIDMMFAYDPREKVERYLTRDKANKYINLVEQSLEDMESDIDPLWVVAMMWQESRFYSKAKSSAGARGLLQIMPGTGAYYDASVVDLLKPKVNIPVGVEYLVYLHDYYGGSLKMATIAYNQGMGNVDRGTYKTWYYNDVHGHYHRMAEMLR